MLVNDIKINELVGKIVEIAKQAGDEILKIYETEDFAVEIKSDDSPLTKADLASHQTIVKALQELTPDIPILSEESVKIAWDERKSWSTYWLIDPLDGTKEFIKRNGEFTVNIALINANQSILGVVYAPVLEAMYWAAEGFGAYKQVQQQPADKIFSLPADMQKPRVVGSRSHQSERMSTFLSQFESVDLLPMGSSLKLCKVAEGLADIYPRLGPTSEWDIAAAQAIVQEAGGQVITAKDQPLRYNSKADLLNPDFFVFADVRFANVIESFQHNEQSNKQ